MAKTNKKSKKNKKNKEEKSLGGLIAKIEEIDKKIELFKTMNRTMPVMILVTLGILTATVYLSSVATVPESDSETVAELPETGEEDTDDGFVLTQNLRIIHPNEDQIENRTFDIIAMSIFGFYKDEYHIEFKYSNYLGESVTIGTAQKGEELGEYRLTWDDAPKGTIQIWAEVIDETGNLKARSESITFEVK